MRLLAVVVLFFSIPSFAQNSLIGDGFGGRLWYVAHNYQIGAYTAYTVCDTNRQLYAWGRNAYGELGNGTTTSTVAPVAVPGMNHLKFYTTGYISAAIKDDNTAWVWGTGNLPNQAQGFGLNPVPLLTDVKFADGAVQHVVFVKNDGTVWGAGLNDYGQLGNGTTSSGTTVIDTPVQMTGVTNAVRAIAVGEFYGASLILLDDSTCKITGSYVFSNVSTTTPVSVPGLSKIVDIKGGSVAAYALNALGDVYSFGSGNNGSLGISNPTGLYQPPTKITFPAGAFSIVALSANCDGDLCLALDSAGHVYAWGANNVGQLGTGNLTDVDSPKLVFSNAIDIFAGENFTYILKSDNTLWASGQSGYTVPIDGSIWMNLTNIQRKSYTQINPTLPPMNLCPPSIFGCIAPDTPTVMVVQPDCATPTGSVTVTVPTGAGLTYSLDDNNYTNTTGIFTGLIPGTYHVTVKSSLGCISEPVTVILNSGQLPAPIVSVTQPNCTTPTGTITVSSPTGSGTSFSIDGIDYTNITGVFTGVVVGTYNVTVKNNAGCVSVPTVVTINAVGATPAAPAVAVTQPNCTAPMGSIIVTTSPGSGFTYSIDGVNYSNTTGIFNNIAAGTYNVTIRNTSGCISPPTVVTIDTAPFIPTAPTVSTIQPNCVMPTGTITVSAPTGVGVTYSIDEVDYSNTTGTFTNLLPRTYYVTAKSSNVMCASNAAPVLIDASLGMPAAPATAVVQPDCITQTGTVSITAPTGLGFTYSIDGINYSNTTGVFIGIMPGSYNLSVKDGNGCTSSPSVVTVAPPPPVPPAPVASVIQPTCPQPLGTINVITPLGSGLSYSIDNVDYTNTTGIFTSVAPGTYNVSVRNLSGCTSSITTATVNAVAGLRLTLTAEPNPVFAGSTIHLVVTGSTPFTVTSWLPQAYFPDQSATSQTIVARAGVTYMVTGKNAFDCRDSAAITIGEKDCSGEDIWVPNTFTPNNDGRNDVFRAYSLCPVNTVLIIRDQWGEKMYEARGLNPSWDGTFKGIPQPTGVYVYVIFSTIIASNKEVIKKGTVNLIR